MTDNFAPENFDTFEEPPDWWDEPPLDGWQPPEPPEEWTPPDLPEVETAAAEHIVPFERDLFAVSAESRIDVPEVPATIWERYLASQPLDKNPDVVEHEQRARGQNLNLIDARFVGVEYHNEVGSPTGYGIACVEVYADAAQAAGITGSYLEIASFDNPLDALALYDTLQTPVEKGWLAPHSVHEFANFAANEQAGAELWRDASPDDLAIYDWYAGHDLAFEPPAEVNTGEQPLTYVYSEAPNTAFNALVAIGIEPADFDPTQDPPPFYDQATGTAYWVGIYQPDLTNPQHCVTSILSLSRNPATGEPEAQLAPCVQGDWNKTFESGQHLLTIIQQDGIDACFLAAESMAVATDQRDLWDTPRGMRLDADYAEQAVVYTQETWELDL